MRYKCFVLLFLTFPFPADGCDITEEYAELRAEAMEYVSNAFRECTDSVSKYFYWKAYSECLSGSGSLENRQTCNESLKYSAQSEVADLEHCEVLRPTEDMWKEYLKELVEERGVGKCDDISTESEHNHALQPTAAPLRSTAAG